VPSKEPERQKAHIRPCLSVRKRLATALVSNVSKHESFWHTGSRRSQKAQETGMHSFSASTHMRLASLQEKPSGEVMGSKRKPVTDWYTLGNGFSCTLRDPLVDAEVLPVDGSNGCLWSYCVVRCDGRLIKRGTAETEQAAKELASSVLQQIQEGEISIP